MTAVSIALLPLLASTAPAASTTPGVGQVVEATLSSDTVHVAPPTGERGTDRASIVAALEEVEPGGTVRFAPGTYLVGQVIPVPKRHLTLLGHPDGTTLRGCQLERYEEIEARIARGAPEPTDWTACGMLELTGGHVTVRNLTFELSRMGLLLGCCHLERRFAMTEGGYLIEGNTFRNSLNGIRPWTMESSTIRGNRFVNTFHAISGAGALLNVLDNEISVPEPGQVPGIGHPSFAISLQSVPAWAAESMGFDANGEGFVIAGNRIEGHPDGILISAHPGTRVHRSEIRDNTIVVHRVPLPVSAFDRSIVDVTDPSDRTVVGIPLALYLTELAPGPPDAAVEEGSFEDNLITGNRLIGAEGVAIAVRRGSRNRIAQNTIRDVSSRSPFPGNTVVSFSELWQEANGSGVWISPGSFGNRIVDNTFEQVAGAAVFLGGDGNLVMTASRDDEVRDLGNGNRLTVGTARADEPWTLPPGMGVFLAVETIAPVVPVRAEDGYHLFYELRLTSFDPRIIELDSLHVVGDDSPPRVLAALGARELGETIENPGRTDVIDPARILPGTHSVVFLSLDLGSDPPPTNLRHRLKLHAGEGAERGTHLLITEPGAVSGEPPVVIGPPLRGGPWYAHAGPANASHHRRTLAPRDGRLTMDQRFASDWLLLKEDTTMSGDVPHTGPDWEQTFGSEVFSVADGRVVRVVDGLPDDPIGPLRPGEVIDWETIGGNRITVDLGAGRFAWFHHLQAGSLRVQPGDSVRRGQVLALAGNSGNSGAPHLHFEITDSETLGKGRGLPFVLECFDLIARAEKMPGWDALENAGQSERPLWDPPLRPVPLADRRRTLEIPLGGAVVFFSESIRGGDDPRSCLR